MGEYTCVTELERGTFTAPVKGLKEVRLGTYKPGAEMRINLQTEVIWLLQKTHTETTKTWRLCLTMTKEHLPLVSSAAHNTQSVFLLSS